MVFLGTHIFILLVVGLPLISVVLPKKSLACRTEAPWGRPDN